MAAAKLESVKAVATIGTPADPEHVTHLIAENKPILKRQAKQM